MTLRLVNLIDRSGEVILTVPKDQNLDNALLIEGYIPDIGVGTITLKIDGPKEYLRTARLYTDVGLLTANPVLAQEVDAVFLALAAGELPPTRRLLLTAPLQMRDHFLRLLDRVAKAARAGRPARVVVKVNALTCPELMAGLIDAGRAGARIDLVVRGACMLPPGVLGLSDRIRVRSIVGRFLEHTRILYMRWGEGADDEALYLSSADWMSRNMFGRVDVAWPIRDAAMRQRVIDECLVRATSGRVP